METILREQAEYGEAVKLAKALQCKNTHFYNKSPGIYITNEYNIFGERQFYLQICVPSSTQETNKEQLREAVNHQLNDLRPQLSQLGYHITNIVPITQLINQKKKQVWVQRVNIVKVV